MKKGILLIFILQLIVLSCNKVKNDNTIEQTRIETKFGLEKSIIYKNLSDEDKSNFISSILYDDKGQVISFYIGDQHLKDNSQELTDLVCLMTKSKSVYIANKDNDLSEIVDIPSKTIGEDGDSGNHSGNPPMVFKNSRNNNVGGCDPYKGAVCIIRW